GGAAEVTLVGDPAALAAALTQLIAHPDHAERLRDAGRERASAYTWAATAEATWGVYGEAQDVPE
ncbi:MAG: glycosyltransferase, partial [Mycobacteriales bacterium]